jgi:DNA-directed RNA polymerase specialized sigma24 family protein
VTSYPADGHKHPGGGEQAERDEADRECFGNASIETRRVTPTDAAVVCGISSEALRQRLSRARAALAARLRETPAVAALKKGFAT